MKQHQQHRHPPHNHPHRQHHAARRLFILLGALVILDVLSLHGNSNNSSASISSSPPSPTAPPPPLFTCPDGRIGLHIIHTRFLISQAHKSSAVFQASRLFLLRSFLLPNLVAQTSRSFILYVSHDPELKPPTAMALEHTLSRSHLAHILRGPETNTTNPNIPIADIYDYIAKLSSSSLSSIPFTKGRWSSTTATNLDTKKISLVITSRIDVDDLAHVEAVEAVQSVACQPSSSSSSLSIKLVYMDKGMLWYPSPTEPYGLTCEWKNAFRSHLAIMQSMVMVAQGGPGRRRQKMRNLLRTCTLNVYSYPHYKPQEIEGNMHAYKGCGAHGVLFSAGEDVVRWRPLFPRSNDTIGATATSTDVIGCLYTKTASSWSWGKLQHKGTECRPADPDRLARLFAGTRQRFASVNALFAGLEEDAPSLVVNSTKQHLE